MIVSEDHLAPLSIANYIEVETDMVASFAEDKEEAQATSSGTQPARVPESAPEPQKPPEPAKAALTKPLETWEYDHPPFDGFHGHNSGIVKKPAIKKAVAPKAVPPKAAPPKPKLEKPKAKNEWPVKKTTKKQPPVDPNRKSMYLPLHVDTSILIPSVLQPKGAKKTNAASEPKSHPVAAYVPKFAAFTSVTSAQTSQAVPLPGNASVPALKTTFTFGSTPAPTSQPAPAADKVEDSTLKAPEIPVVKAPEIPVVKAPEIPVVKAPEIPVVKAPETPEEEQPETPEEEEPEAPIVVPPPGERKSK
jgi:hypothetical protein